MLSCGSEKTAETPARGIQRRPNSPWPRQQLIFAGSLEAFILKLQNLSRNDRGTERETATTPFVPLVVEMLETSCGLLSFFRVLKGFTGFARNSGSMVCRFVEALRTSKITSKFFRARGGAVVLGVVTECTARVRCNRRSSRKKSTPLLAQLMSLVFDV